MQIKYPVQNVHASSVEEIVKAFRTDAGAGLATTEAEDRMHAFGPNSYEAQDQESIWLILLRQFMSPIVYLLAFGAAVSFVYDDIIEGISILVVILINALIGFLMEIQARSSMKALKEMDVIMSNVIREGQILEMPSEKLTPGDIVLLEAGDVVPGDGRLLEANQLQCDESSLTGESLPSEKNIASLPKDTALGDRLNMVFKGSSVMNGTGRALVTGIGKNTELGTITSLVESSGETATPLDKKLNALSKMLIWITLIMTSIFAVTGIMQGKKWMLILETSIALAVAAIPEGLPIVSTVALAYGVLLMARRNAIVKSLSSVETLGSTNVILTDKTGTLTENKIYVNTFSFPEENFQVRIENDSLIFVHGKIETSKENFEKMRLVGALCNNATIKITDGKEKLLGDPIEIALIQLADTSGSSAGELIKKYQRIAEVPFNSDTKIMGTFSRGQNDQVVAAKGSVEDLLARCSSMQMGPAVKTLGEEERKEILLQSEKMAADGLRVLAFAIRTGTSLNEENYLNELVYLGMIGFLDPPRLDIREAITTCRKAGIKIVMITGDHPLTALNIAKKTGLVDEGEQNVITGKDLPPMDSLTAEWEKRILTTAIFARATPRQKLEIAGIYQKAGNIVAMTGDGVNDAPALKAADIGIAMGLRGTQVAKEAAGIVLKDDSFISISAAVAHGRAIFQNIRQFVVYLVSCNLSEIFVVTSLGILFPASTLLPLQILFLNMVTDIFPALALGLGKGDQSIMDEPPADPKAAIIPNRGWITIALYAAAMTLSVISAVIYCKKALAIDDQAANNVAFITLAFAQLFHVFNMSAAHSGMLVNDITRNKFVWLAFILCAGIMILIYQFPQMRIALSLVHLPLKVWMVSILASTLPLVLVQLYKGIGLMSARH